ESRAAAGRWLRSRPKSAPEIPTSKACAWLLPTGLESYGCCKRGDGWPLLRHVWPTFARAATGWRVGQRLRDNGQGAGVEARSKKARRGRSRAGQGEG